MAAFEYKALDAAGRAQKGVMEADSARQIRQVLREKGWMPLEVEATTVRQKGANGALFQRRPGLSVKQQALITRQLATLIQSGIPIEESLRACSEQTDKPAIRSMLMAIRAKVLEGYTLADSLGEFPAAFSKLYRSTVAAGEHAGHLELVLNRLADYTESRQQARQKIQLAAIYPMILTLVAVSIVVFLLTYVVPDIITVFVRNGQELPGLTQALLSASDFLGAWGIYLALVIVACGVGFKLMLKKDAFRLKVHKQLLHTPFISR